MLTSHIIRVAVEAALAEDAPYGDITCETTIPADETGSAHLTARENGVMSGIDVFAAAFAAQNPAVTVTAAIKDGERFQRGQILATVKGPVRDLLTAERIALNFTQRMSGRRARRRSGHHHAGQFLARRHPSRRGAHRR